MEEFSKKFLVEITGIFGKKSGQILERTAEYFCSTKLLEKPLEAILDKTSVEHHEILKKKVAHAVSTKSYYKS